MIIGSSKNDTPNDSRNGSVYGSVYGAVNSSVYGGFKTVLVKIIGKNFNKLILYCNFVANSLIRLGEMSKRLY